MPLPLPIPLLRLTLTPGLGPVLIARLLAAFGSAERVIAAEPSSLRAIKGIGPERAAQITKGIRESEKLLEAELAEIERRHVTLIALGSPYYPPLLAQAPDAPPILYVRGTLDASAETSPDRYTLAIVGSRKCTHYGTEQAERFATVLASSGVTVVSGGARGIDTAAHRAALRSKGRTIAVLGCGLSNCYPPDNAELFEQIAGAPGDSPASSHGCIVSELPMTAPPSAENFPARNRIIAALSLGTLVIEAASGSGALITARQAIDLGREVFALPGRVDSAASEGSLGLLKEGAAALVTEPADVLNQLESPARHLHKGTHEARYGDPASLFGSASLSADAPRKPATPVNLSDTQKSILAAAQSARSVDELCRDLSMEPGALRGELTMLEIRKLIKREGTRVIAASPP